MHSIFENSLPKNEKKIGNALTEIVDEYVHPLCAMADTFGLPIEESGAGFKSSSFKVRNSDKEDIVDRFIFPEPEDLFHLCVYLKVHPADLIPEEFRELPSPRSVVQLCKLIATDYRFSEYDRNLADDFLDREIQVCFLLADKDHTLWEMMEGLEVIAAICAEEDAEVEWIKNHPDPESDSAQVSKEILTDNFSQAILSVPADLSSFPLAPSAENRLQGMYLDRAGLEQTQVKLADLLLEKEIAFKALEELGDKIFGEGNTLEAYEGTKKVVTSIAENKPMPPSVMSVFLTQNNVAGKSLFKQLGFESEDKMNEAWLKLCKAYSLAEKASDKWQKIFDHNEKAFNELYDPNFTTSENFELALATFETYTILQNDSHIPPFWEHEMFALNPMLNTDISGKNTPKP